MIDDFKIGMDHIDLFGYGPTPCRKPLAWNGTTLTRADGTSILLAGVAQRVADTMR